MNIRAFASRAMAAWSISVSSIRCSFQSREEAGALGGRFRVAQANRTRIAMRLLSFSHCKGLESGDTPQNRRLKAVPEAGDGDGAGARVLGGRAFSFWAPGTFANSPPDVAGADAWPACARTN